MNEQQEERVLWDKLVFQATMMPEFTDIDFAVHWANEIISARRKLFGEPKSEPA